MKCIFRGSYLRPLAVYCRDKMKAQMGVFITASNRLRLLQSGTGFMQVPTCSISILSGSPCSIITRQEYGEEYGQSRTESLYMLAFTYFDGVFKGTSMSVMVLFLADYLLKKLVLCECYMLQGLKPLYEKLHAYVRNKLATQYPGKVLLDDEDILYSFLVNMWLILDDKDTGLLQFLVNNFGVLGSTWWGLACTPAWKHVGLHYC